jgi:hypothetical protein
MIEGFSDRFIKECFCQECSYLSPDQPVNPSWVQPHYCYKYDTQVFHHNYERDYIYKCSQCSMEYQQKYNSRR